MRQQVLFLEYNEINFEFLEHYIAHGELPNFAACLSEYGYTRTTSETKHEDLEPWIQWVTAHTGMTLAQHGIYRLGDVVRHEIPQIWERLEEHGFRVGAISPMNARNRTHAAAFFVPDPWTTTEVTGSALLRKMYSAISQAVNDNAQSRLTIESMAWLLGGAAWYARAANYAQYLALAAMSSRKPWAKAMFLDALLADVFVGQTKRSRPDFATLFLNAAAHIQHHYMYSSAAYSGPRKNPDWYVGKAFDPLLESYKLYDRILGQIRAEFPEARILMATGLHQDPHGEVTYYWRLADHIGFLRRFGVPFVRVEPRMSRDFLVTCESPGDVATAGRILESAVDESGCPLFEVDNRGIDLFVMLTYPSPIGEDFVYRVDGRTYKGLRRDVAFVAIKNGDHNGVGYFVDSGVPKGTHGAEFPLAEIPNKVMEALGVESTVPTRSRRLGVIHAAGAAWSALPVMMGDVLAWMV